MYSGLIYIILYVIVTFFFFFSKDLFWVIGAFLFGAFWSGCLVWIAETINAVILFYFARSLGKIYLEHSLPERYGRIYKKLGKLNFPWLFVFRAAPLIPYRFMDLGAGLTSISFGKYMAAVILGSPVKIFWLQYLLRAIGSSVFGDPYKLVEYFLANRAILFLSFIYVILVVIVALKIKFKE